MNFDFMQANQSLSSLIFFFSFGRLGKGGLFYFEEWSWVESGGGGWKGRGQRMLKRGFNFGGGVIFFNFFLAG